LNLHRLAPAASPALALSVILLAALTACGGGNGSPADSSAAPTTAPTTAEQASSEIALDSATTAALAQTEAQPAYHLAPALIDEPSQADVGGTNASAQLGPKRFDVDASVADIDTARLSRAALAQRLSDSSRARIASASGSSAAPQATTIVGAVHTPAQIRAAYGLAALPAVGTAITPAVAATLGAGQTIYIIDAYHDATALADLNAFSARFGLPTCTNVAIAANATLPLATPPSSCTFSAVYSTTAYAMTATVPVYNATWAPESKLDVQWAHAIAPLARIVLIEMPNSLSTSILGANLLASKLGKGVVSMSFGSAEAGWSPSVDSYFASAGMTYVAAAGDSGSQVLWPAVSPNVLAVGGTSLNWSGTGTRYEAAWSMSGGGMSAHEALPAWQSGVSAAGGGALARRAVPDVAFNANPMTGEYVALTLPGASTVWSAYGGTSIAAPQWAGVIAVANAIRAANGKATLGDIHTLLYKSIAPVPGVYAASLGDIVDGTNGSCATCRAGAGFDLATGWGTPNSAGLLNALTGVATPAAAPAPTAAPAFSTGGYYNGTAGVAFSGPLSATNPNHSTLTFKISDAPAGLVAGTTGGLSWAAPVAGNYKFTATVTDGLGMSTTQTESVTIAGVTPAAVVATNHAPTLAALSWSAKSGTAFGTMLAGADVDGGALTYTVSGAPAGMNVMSSGFVSWAAPAKGSYAMTVTVHDNKGATGSAVMHLNVS
jgi:hypothetical protein